MAIARSHGGGGVTSCYQDWAVEEESSEVAGLDGGNLEGNVGSILHIDLHSAVSTIASASQIQDRS